VTREVYARFPWRKYDLSNRLQPIKLKGKTILRETIMTGAARTIEARLRELGVELPAAVAPIANYVPFVRSGSWLIISGQLPLDNGRLPDAFKGKLGKDIFNEAGQQAARLAAINVLAQAQVALGDLDRVRRVLRLGGFINAAPGFTALPAVMNGASDLMVQVFGDHGRHARTTVGVSELPLDAAVEIEAMIEFA
jgi:enamine deaminase RidA (YjgF/YER057c/UK114 family)